MANGKVGDHPYTDVVVYRLDVYSRRAAELIRAIDALADEATRAQLSDLLLREYNDFLNPDVPRLEKYLTVLHERLQRDAHNRGWESVTNPDRTNSHKTTPVRSKVTL